MKMFDPNRIMLGPDQPAYGDPPIASIPPLEMRPKSHGLTEISAMLAVGINSYAWFRNFADTRQIPNLLESYHNDPEKFLQSFFDYKIPGKDILDTQKSEMRTFGVATYAGKRVRFLENDEIPETQGLTDARARVMNKTLPAGKKTFSINDL